MPVALVTGASRGIGRAVALRLAAGGSDILGVARDAGSLSSLAAEVAQRGGEFLPIAADLTDPAAVREASEAAWSWRGKVDALVNAAGMLIRKPEGEISDVEWDLTLALNVRAPFLLLEDLGRRMYEAGAGSVVNVASIAGERVTGAPAPYQLSKAALIQLTRFYAARLAPRVRVNAVGPGYVRTHLSEDWLADPANEEWVESRTPLGRIATPDDIAGPVAFLLSEDASYVTGQHLLVDGGWSVR
jgi:NAD(P)-dependent dehydrogenase (short-subunit alcohol dehydrogenase family)